MGKPIPDEVKKAFEEFAEKRLADEDLCGNFRTDELDFIDEDEDNVWEFHASNHDPDNTFDFYELFDSSPKFQVEEHGYDDFYVIQREED